MRSPLRTFFLGLVCLLFIASSDVTVNVYGHRSGRPLAAAQSSSVVPVFPTSRQTPFTSGDLPVSSPENTGHGLTSAEGYTNIWPAREDKSCRWFAFQPVSGPITRITLKFDWSVSGFVETNSPENVQDSAFAQAKFLILYSTDNGSTDTYAIQRGEGSSIWGTGYENKPFSDSGSFSIDLPPNTPINQIVVRDRLSAEASGSGLGVGSARVDARIWDIKLEVEVVNCIENVPGNRWKGEYFANQTLSGNPVMVRDDSSPNTNFLIRDFSSGSPHSLCVPRVDDFSARWTRTVDLAQGIYRFTVTVDNGVRLYVDGYLRIDQWGNLPLNTYTADVFLSAGDHEIRVEFIEYTGNARVSLSWAAVSGANCYASVTEDRWKGEYFSNTNLAGSTARVSNDGGGSLNFNFGSGGPGSGCGLGEDYFSARWTRTVILGAGVYRFSVTGDDGVRLYVDGNLLINKWFKQEVTTYTADVTLLAGPHNVKLEYFESDGPAVAILSWADLTGVNCLPNAPLPLISSLPQAGGGENIASTAPSQAPKRCGQKNSD
jgi:PA14 domain-containing protein